MGSLCSVSNDYAVNMGMDHAVNMGMDHAVNMGMDHWLENRLRLARVISFITVTPIEFSSTKERRPANVSNGRVLRHDLLPFRKHATLLK